MNAARSLTKAFPWWAYWISLTVILIFTLWPIGSVMLASVVAGANGCALDEGSVHACVIGGTDWGDTLYAMAVMAWLGLVTLPLGFGAGIVWVISLIIHRLAWRKYKDAGQ